MNKLSLSLTVIALGLSMSVNAKGLFDVNVVDKVVNTINTTKSTATNQSTVTASIPDVFQGKWGWVDGSINGCTDEDGQGLLIVDSNRIDGYEAHYVLKQSNQITVDNQFTGLFRFNEFVQNEQEGLGDDANVKLSVTDNGKLTINDNDSGNSRIYNKCPTVVARQDKNSQLNNIISMIKDGTDYKNARALLIQAGWRPQRVCEPDGTAFKPCKNFPEVEYCSGVEVGYCLMRFYKSNDSCLTVNSEGGPPSAKMKKGDVTVVSTELTDCSI